MYKRQHEYQKIEKWDYADLKDMCNMEAVEEFRKKALNPESPKMRGSHENGDVYKRQVQRPSGRRHWRAAFRRWCSTPAT